MKKLSKKQLLIGVCLILAIICIAVIAIFLTGKFTSKSKNSYTVKFELCTELKTTTVLDRTVPAGSFLEEPEVYVTGENKENWSISGWYTEPEYVLQWDFDFDTVESDLTLYAKWEAKPECTVSFYTEEAQEAVYITKVRKGLVTSRCDEEFMGREVLGYYADKAMTQVFDFAKEIEEDTNIYVEISDYVYFSAKTLSKWNLCGNQSEATKYQMSAQLSKDESKLTVTSKDGGYLWLSNLSLRMNDTSIIEIKAREVNDNYSGIIGGYIIGDYNINGTLGGSADFGQTNTGTMIYTRSAKPDEEGYYTYSYNISNLTPGLVYDEMAGLRIDFYGSDKYTYEIKEVKTYVDKYAVSAEAFLANGIDFNGLHLNTFSLMGEAETEMLANGDLRFGGKDGAFIFKKDIEIKLGDEQRIRLKAKGDLNGGAIALFLYGDYSLNGKAGSITDYTSKHMVYFTPVSTDSDGYTVYVADIGSIAGLKYNVIRGLRLDLYGEGTRSIAIQSMKSYAPTKEETEVKNDFKAQGLDFTGIHLSQFLTYGGAQTKQLSNGDFRFSGSDGSMIYKKDVEITLREEQRITLRAKGNLEGGAIGLYLYGDYTMNGTSKTKTDYDAEHMWIMQAGETDAEGYTTYTADISSISGLKYNVIRGLRLDLYGEGTRTIEITSLKSSIPETGNEGGKDDETEQPEDLFKATGLDLIGTHFNQFLTEGGAVTELLANGDFSFGGPDSAFIFKKDMEITLGEDQLIVLKAKGDLKGGAVGMYLFGDYTMNGTPGTLNDYGPHMWIVQVGETDQDGYTTYTVDISSILGLKYNVIRGIRIDLYGGDTRTIEITSLKSSTPETGGEGGNDDETEQPEDLFKATGLDFTGTHFNQFLTEGGAVTELLANGDFSFGGPDSAFVFKKDMEITLGEDQLIVLKAKGDLKGGIIGLFMYGDYTMNGVAGSKADYDAEHMWIMQAGETDADGYTTYTVDIDSISGLKYNVIRGIRLDLYGGDTRTIEITSLKSSTPETGGEGGNDDETEQPEDLFKATGLDLIGTHFNQFLTEGGAVTELLANGDFSFGGPDSAFIFKKDMEITLGEDQLIVLKAKGDLKGGAIGMYLFGDYTMNGTPGTLNDYGPHMWIVQVGETGEDGYTTYTVDISSILGLKYNVIRGIRIDLYGGDTRTIEIQSLQSAEKNTSADTVLFLPEDLSVFEPLGGATTELTSEGNFRMTGLDGSFVHKKGLAIDVSNAQKIEMKAKVTSGAAIGVYLFGDYTKGGVASEITDYDGNYVWVMEAGETDAEGYTTYTLDLRTTATGITELLWKTLKGFRVELWGGGTIALEIEEIKAVPVS